MCIIFNDDNIRNNTLESSDGVNLHPRNTKLMHYRLHRVIEFLNNLIFNYLKNKHSDSKVLSLEY